MHANTHSLTVPDLIDLGDWLMIGLLWYDGAQILFSLWLEMWWQDQSCCFFFSLVLLLTFRDYNLILEYCLCYPSFCMMYSSVIPLDVFSFMDICSCFVIWCIALLTWDIYSFAHCGLEAWPIMENIEFSSLGSEIWPREFEAVTHSLMIRVVPYSLSHIDFALTYIHPLWALHNITLETIIWHFHPQLFYFCTSPLWSNQVECEEFEPGVDIAWRWMAYDF